jgi:hypothetical protein
VPNRNAEKIQKYLRNGALLVIAALLIAAFLLAQNQGGRTWDEGVHVFGIRQQVGLVSDWLHGNLGRSYGDLGGDPKYYGIAPVLLTYVVLEVLKWVGTTTDSGAVQVCAAVTKPSTGTPALC